MELRRLDLVAFGPFTNRVLEFGAGPGGLHIVYGPNEAGKSSALRGLLSLLYGIDERTPDNFLHANRELRIGGRLRSADGAALTFVRRKGRKDTLLSADGKPLDDNALMPYLHGVTQELFATLFGIDHAALVSGGREILEQKGEVGQALFSASIGNAALHRILESLDEESAELFRPRGSTKAINIALKKYAGLTKEARESSLSSRKWEEHRRSLTKTIEELEQVRRQIGLAQAETTRLKRIQRVLPKLARRRRFLAELREMGEVVSLPENFRDRHAEAVGERETARAMIEKASSRLSALRAQHDALAVRKDVLDHGEAIEVLHAGLGAYRKSMQDRPHLAAERSQLLADAESLLLDIRPGLALSEVETLRPVLIRRRRIAALGNEHRALVERVQQAEERRVETETLLQQKRQILAALPEAAPPDALRRVVTAAGRAGDLDKLLRDREAEMHVAVQECEEALARLPLWQGTHDDVPLLSVPSKESIDRFETQFDALERRSSRLDDKREEAGEKLRDLERQLDEVRRTGAVPSEQDLLDARADRNEGWKLLRRQWLEKQDVGKAAEAFDSELSLPEAFERKVTGADDLADRMRRESGRVHQRASLEAGLASEQMQIKKLDHGLEAGVQEKMDLDSGWSASWAPCGIEPRSPREMRAWLDSFQKLRNQFAQLRLLRQRVNDAGEERSNHIQALTRELQALERTVPEPASFGAALDLGEETVAAGEELLRQREGLDREIHRLQQEAGVALADKKSAESGLEEWQAQWREAIAELGLGADALPAEANEIVENLQSLFGKLGNAEELSVRIGGIDEDGDTFREQVTSLLTKTAPELSELPAAEAVSRMNLLLKTNQLNESSRRQAAEQMKAAQREIKEAGSTIGVVDERLQGFCLEARCDGPEYLGAAERRSDEHRDLNSQLNAVEREILETGESGTLEELEEEAGGVDPDSLSGKIQELAGRIEQELGPGQAKLAETKGRQQKELELMDGGDRAAELAQQAQAVLAGIRSKAEEYTRVKLAAYILRHEIERYRKDNQGPLMDRASEHFASLTLGSFEGLRTDFNEKDEPVLVGVRPNGDLVEVEGMSSGTRDQLYLALRLASLEKYIEHAEPMPFIVDDILVHFDDRRSKATLIRLAQLAEKTQVIIFTHHSRLVEQARALEAEAPVEVHELNGG